MTFPRDYGFLVFEPFGGSEGSPPSTTVVITEVYVTEQLEAE
jgi:hypothetical protein